MPPSILRVLAFALGLGHLVVSMWLPLQTSLPHTLRKGEREGDSSLHSFLRRASPLRPSQQTSCPLGPTRSLYLEEDS